MKLMKLFNRKKKEETTVVATLPKIPEVDVDASKTYVSSETVNKLIESLNNNRILWEISCNPYNSIFAEYRKTYKTIKIAVYPSNDGKITIGDLTSFISEEDGSKLREVLKEILQLQKEESIANKQKEAKDIDRFINENL